MFHAEARSGRTATFGDVRGEEMRCKECVKENSATPRESLVLSRPPLSRCAIHLPRFFKNDATSRCPQRRGAKGAPSMHHQDRDHRVGDDVLGDAAEDRFDHLAVAIAAADEEIEALVGGGLEQNFRRRGIAARQELGLAS